jgi:hypothetical protein
MSETAPPVPPKLVRADELLAGTIREQARAVMRWAVELNRAQLAGDWAAVAAVRADIAECSQGLALFACDLEQRAALVARARK